MMPSDSFALRPSPGRHHPSIVPGDDLMRSRRIALIGVLFSLLGLQATAQLSGAYTVGPAGNYLDLTTALAALQANGVSGPVQFSVQANQTGPWTLSAFAGQGAA